MSNSLRDQLAKAGLVTEQQVRQAEHQQQQQRRHKPARGSPGAPDPGRLAAEQARAAKLARDQELNRRAAEKAERRAREAQLRQLIEQSRLPASEAEGAYSFQDGAYVRRIAVDDVQRGQLMRGELAIARLGKSFALVPAAAAARIRERDPQAIVDLPAAAAAPDEQDDRYKGFEVPDDLIW
jgi:uncharacterized protein YaiL (DUF2058 family)